MPANGDNGGRLTRLEEFVEVLANEHIQFAQEHRLLLTAQVLLTDRMDKLAQSQAVTDERFKETDQRLGILIGMMDEWIKRHPA